MTNSSFFTADRATHLKIVASRCSPPSPSWSSASRPGRSVETSGTQVVKTPADAGDAAPTLAPSR